VRSFLVKLCGLLLKIFFRRIEIVGLDLLPREGSLLFAGNHPSGLIDPLFILCLSSRRVSFLAKEPLFRTPVVGMFVRAFECLPVYRAVDGADPKQNRAMMQSAVELLSRGNALAIFPEGTSHSEPSLKRFRSGAARIALSARGLTSAPVHIIPVALYYERKESFRSRAVLAFGTALEVPLTDLDDGGNSPIDAGNALTQQIASAVESLMPTAESAEGLLLAEHSERLLNSAIRDLPSHCPNVRRLIDSEPDSRPSLSARMKLRRRLISSYRHFVSSQPEFTSELVRRIELIRDVLEQHALPIDARPSAAAHVRLSAFLSLSLSLLISPLALVGFVTHAPAYYLIRFIAFRFSKEASDVTATVKLVGGLLFFPLSWGVVSSYCYLTAGPELALFILFFLPLSAWFNLLFLSLFERAVRTFKLRTGVMRATINWEKLTLERAAVADEVARLMLAVETEQMGNIGPNDLLQAEIEAASSD
jgi:glycerol-3-phosphate O-acyltransferase/dihydroxyacetone phosphate acyltransferase